MKCAPSRLLVIAFILIDVVAGGGCKETKPSEASSSAEAIPPAGVAGWALPESAFKTQWEDCTIRGPIPAGSINRVQVRFKNISDTSWPDPPAADPKLKQGAYAVRLSYRWLNDDGRHFVTTYAGTRFDLPKSVGPGESVNVPVDVKAPAEAGHYQLQFDLVQELVAWFQDKGAATCLQRVDVR